MKLPTTLGRFHDSHLIEGTDESRREAGQLNRRRARIAAARSYRRWVEVDLDDLAPRRFAGRTFLASASTSALYKQSNASVFQEEVRPDGHVSIAVLNEGSVVAFAVDNEDGLVLFERAPMTVTQLDHVERRQQQERSRADLAAQHAEIELREFRAAQPTVQITLSDLQGRQLPTVQQAARMILNHGGTLTVRDGRLQVGLPARLAPTDSQDAAIRPALVDAAAVLIAAGQVVTGAVESNSKQPLPDRLPAAEVLAAGGLA